MAFLIAKGPGHPLALVAFSFFYWAMSYSSGQNGSLTQILIATRMVQELVELCRGEKGLTPFFHLLGAVNGIIYSRFIIDKVKLPSALLRSLEDKFEGYTGRLLGFFGKENSGWLELVLTNDDDDKDEVACNQDASDDTTFEDLVKEALDTLGGDDRGWFESVLNNDDIGDSDFDAIDDTDGQLDESDLYGDRSDADTECEPGMDSHGQALRMYLS